MPKCACHRVRNLSLRSCYIKGHDINFVGNSYNVVLQFCRPLHPQTTLGHQFPLFYTLNASKNHGKSKRNFKITMNPSHKGETCPFLKLFFKVLMVAMLFYMAPK